MPESIRSRPRISRLAKQDIGAIARWTVREFGLDASLRYNALIIQAIDDIAADPNRIGSCDLPGIKRLRTYHLELSRTRVTGERVKEPRHLIVYRQNREGSVEIARVLYDARNIVTLPPARYLAKGN
jgi:toxin ParE1/3/4